MVMLKVRAWFLKLVVQRFEFGARLWPEAYRAARRRGHASSQHRGWSTIEGAVGAE